MDIFAQFAEFKEPSKRRVRLLQKNRKSKKGM